MKNPLTQKIWKDNTSSKTGEKKKKGKKELDDKSSFNPSTFFQSLLRTTKNFRVFSFFSLFFFSSNLLKDASFYPLEIRVPAL